VKRLVALAPFLAFLAASAAAQDVHDALGAGDLICEFRNPLQHDLLAGLRYEPPRANLMLVYERVAAESAQVISSGRVGKRPIVVRAANDMLHFIERDGPSVRVTALTECKDTRWKDGVETCVRFSARHAWHFDTHGTLGPDPARVRLPAGASVGVCEAWNAD
jgi:hypothetical protein